MTIEEEIKIILELWYNNIKPEVRGDLANLWEHRKGLGELEALVERLEPKVIKLLEVIPTLKRHSHEYHARTVDLVKLLHHFNKYSKDEWVQKVTSDLDYISKEITQARNKAEEILRGRKSTEPTDEEKSKLIQIWESCYSPSEFQQKVSPLGYQFQIYNARSLVDTTVRKIEDIWIVSRGGKNFLFPAYNVKPVADLWMFYDGGNPRKPVSNIKSLVEVEYDGRDNIWFPVSGKKGIIN